MGHRTKYVFITGGVVAPGFGERGLEGKIHAIHYIREKGIPFLGSAGKLCGMC